MFSGSQRDDGRSWIDFHDGLSNLKPAERAEAIVIGAGSDEPRDAWTINGSYLAFIRLGINLAIWRDSTIRNKSGSWVVTSSPAAPRVVR